jgi:hypothetical protein
LSGLIPNNYIHVFLSDLYIPWICPHIWLRQNNFQFAAVFFSLLLSFQFAAVFSVRCCLSQFAAVFLISLLSFLEEGHISHLLRQLTSQNLTLKIPSMG